MEPLFFSYGFRFWVSLTLAVCLFLFTKEKRETFPAAFPVCLLVSAIVLFWLYMRPDTFLNSIQAFLISIGLMILMGLLCFDIGVSDALFCALGGYGVQHISSLAIGCLQAMVPVSLFPNTLAGAFAQLLFRLFLYVLFFALFGKRLRNGGHVSLEKGPLLMVLSLAVVLEIVLYDIIRRSFAENPQDLLYLAQNLTSMLCAFTILLLQFTLLQQHSLENELHVLKQMQQMEQQQYKISSATIDQINMKCHDMRHQIRRIGTRTQMDPEALTDMENVIGIYDSMPKTGCRALDIILAEKNLYCQQNHITISCIADGKKLAFLSDADIYSLFGNILDNAIQAVLPLPEDQRDIGLSVRQEGGFLSIHSHNYYGGELILKEGIPHTTQKDESVHGFGIQSMRQVVQKYGGDISFHAADSVFELNILFPEA